MRADGYGFGFRWGVDESAAWPRTELDRTVAAIEAGEMVATGRNYTLELTMPGAATVPAGGVSWISTRPTHRRRGFLTRVMRHLVDESRARGELASLLTASEGGIYPRFGYGVATRIATLRARAWQVPSSGTRRRRAPRCGWWSRRSPGRWRPSCSSASGGCGPAPCRARRPGGSTSGRRRSGSTRSVASTSCSTSTASPPATPSTRSTAPGGRASPRRSWSYGICSPSRPRRSARCGSSSPTSTRRSQSGRGTARSTTRSRGCSPTRATSERPRCATSCGSVRSTPPRSSARAPTDARAS